MTPNSPPSFLGRLFRDLDDNHSPVYITLAVLCYLIPVILISILFFGSTTSSARFDIAYVALFWVIIVILPLMMTFGVFIVYRATYTARTYVDINSDGLPDKLRKGDIAWDSVINKALDWRRFLMPLCLLNMFITLISGFLLYSDISIASGFEEAQRNDIIFGFYDIKLFFGEPEIIVPGSLFYLGLLGFMVHFLEMTRRRYVSRNLVPRFYLISGFRSIQVMVISVIVYFSLLIVTDNYYIHMVTAFTVGMFPLQLLTPVVEGARQRLGMSPPKKLSLALINGIDNTLESLLQEENIDSIQILATSELSEIQKRTAIPEKTLLNWQRQARLFDVLGTEELIHRFARIGINDFDDILVLVNTMEGLPLDSKAFREDFTNAMRISADDEAIGTDAFWRVMVYILIREYRAVYPAETLDSSELIPMENPIVEDTVHPSEPIVQNMTAS